MPAAPLSRRRLAIALAVAGVSDVLSVWLEFAPPLQWALDIVTALALFGILGRQWLLLPALISEAIPGIAAFPAWVLVVLAIGVTGNRAAAPQPAAGAGPASPPLLATGAKILAGAPLAKGFSPGCLWAGATVAIVFILTAAFLLLRSCEAPVRLVDKIGSGLRGLFTTNYRVTTLVTSAIGELQHESKIVVLTAKFPVTITKSSAKSWELLGQSLDLGTTSVQITALDNRAQYVIPTDGIGFRLNTDPREIIVEIPPPVLDETIIEVQSNPDRIAIVTDAGWARSRFLSGKSLEDDIRRGFRPMVLLEGRHPIRLQIAAEHARKTVADMLTGLLKKHGLAIPVRVVIKAAPAAQELP